MPRRLWMLWLQGFDRAPALVRACLDSWRRWNPDWTIETLDASRLAEWIPETRAHGEAWTRQPPQVAADLVRVSLLERHGGVWVDASCLCRKPLDAWLPAATRAGFFAFARPGPDRLLSTWFLAGTPGHPLLARWRALADAYWEGAPPRTPVWHPEELVRRPELAARRADRMAWFDEAPPGGGAHYPYFWLHYAFERALADPALAALWDAVPGSSADAPHRPQRLGLQRPADEAAKGTLREEDAPLYKLNLKKPFDPDDRSTVGGWCIDAALRSAG